ncbi:hypothetical protein H7J93_25890 [Mycobacterium barrassiae]|uniref:Rv0361 family membrane protein n=1 Tax=Mycobacterium barrassiae TaxID=319709 RepID=UPI002265A1FF|nr:hypothetical protein [Mycobacterium barrassiae]MCV7303060.1 hypothetical protein [Mycobacterium barrassiae]
MSGPYPPEYGAGPVAPQMYPETGPQPFPQEPYPQTYPGMLPPPVPYPKKRRWPLLVGLLAIVAVAAVVAGIVFATRGNDGTSAGSATLTDASAKAAIQEYLDAMTNGDDETVARHTLCGLFDAVKERRSDMALANLASDAFRQQYGRAEVTSIDKIVMWSPNQAQVLFTMQVEPSNSSRRGQPRPKGEQQAVAQLLTQGDEVLVCSYLPRTAGQY